MLFQGMFPDVEIKIFSIRDLLSNIFWQVNGATSQGGKREAKGVVFNALWSEIGYRFLLFGSSEIEYGVMRSLEPVSKMVLCIFCFCFFPFIPTSSEFFYPVFCDSLVELRPKVGREVSLLL